MCVCVCSGFRLAAMKPEPGRRLKECLEHWGLLDGSLFSVRYWRSSPPFESRIKFLKASISDINFPNLDSTDVNPTGSARQKPTGIPCARGREKRQAKPPSKLPSITTCLYDSRIWKFPRYTGEVLFSSLGWKAFTLKVSNWGIESIKAWSGGIYFIQPASGCP